MKKTFENIIILGAGESGVGAAILAKSKGMNVFVSDKGKIKESYQTEMKEYGIEFESEQHSVDRILEADLIIKSPGIPEKVQLIQDAFAKNIPVVSEI